MTTVNDIDLLDELAVQTEKSSTTMIPETTESVTQTTVELTSMSEPSITTTTNVEILKSTQSDSLTDSTTFVVSSASVTKHVDVITTQMVSLNL